MGRSLIDLLGTIQTLDSISSNVLGLPPQAKAV